MRQLLLSVAAAEQQQQSDDHPHQQQKPAKRFFLTLPHPRRFDPGDSVVKQMQLSLLIAATRKWADWRRGNDENGCRILCAEVRWILCWILHNIVQNILCRCSLRGVYCYGLDSFGSFGFCHLLKSAKNYWYMKWFFELAYGLQLNNLAWDDRKDSTDGRWQSKLSDILNSTLPSPHQVGLSAG